MPNKFENNEWHEKGSEVDMARAIIESGKMFNMLEGIGKLYGIAQHD